MEEGAAFEGGVFDDGAGVVAERAPSLPAGRGSLDRGARRAVSGARRAVSGARRAVSLPEFTADDPNATTRYLRDASRQVLTTNDSPGNDTPGNDSPGNDTPGNDTPGNDSPNIGFRTSLNPYRGCEHGCSYCYARPTHEYLGFSAGLDFESRILVKTDAADLLRAELSARRWKPQPIAMSGVTDPYQPIERRLGITRACLEVLREFRNPVGVVTKSHLVTRDVDVLSDMASFGGAVVCISLTSLSGRLTRAMEPRASGPAHRLHAIHRLADAAIPVGVMVAPVVPGLTDEEIPAILEAAANAGATFANYVVLRLPHAVKDIFRDWLLRELPDRAEKVLSRVRDLRARPGTAGDPGCGRAREARSGKDRAAYNDPRFGTRMRGEGPLAERIGDLFRISRRRAGLAERGPQLSAGEFRRGGARQLALF
jgi:DNA repair photolyase